MKKINTKGALFRRYVIILFFVLSIQGYSQSKFEYLFNSIAETTFGDLDKDGIPELVVVVNTDKLDDKYIGVTRELHILKKINGVYQLWRKFDTALLPSNADCFDRDPLKEVTVKNGVLVINHWGGARWKWNRIERYRFQDNHFELIGYTLIEGYPVDYQMKVDYNLSTNTIHFSREISDNYVFHDEEKKRSMNTTHSYNCPTITLENRNAHHYSIKIPEADYTLDL